MSSPTWPVPPTAAASGGGTPHWPVATEPYDTGMPLEPLAVQEEAAANGPTYWVEAPGIHKSFSPRSAQIQRLGRVFTAIEVVIFLVAFGLLAWYIDHQRFALAPVIMIAIAIGLLLVDVVFMMTVGRRLDDRYVERARRTGVPPAPVPLPRSPAGRRLDRVVYGAIFAVCVGSGIVYWYLQRHDGSFWSGSVLALIALVVSLVIMAISAVVGHHLDRRYAEQSPGGDGTPPLFVEGGTR